MGASNGRFTVSGPLPVHVHTSCFLSAGVHLLTSRWKVKFSPSSWLVFASLWKVTNAGPSAIDRLAWNTTANYMDFLPRK